MKHRAASAFAPSLPFVLGSALALIACAQESRPPETPVEAQSGMTTQTTPAGAVAATPPPPAPPPAAVIATEPSTTSAPRPGSATSLAASPPASTSGLMSKGGPPAAGAASGGIAAGSACTKDADCKLNDVYCDSCQCLPSLKSESAPACKGKQVACLVAPCMRKKAVCRASQCAIDQP